MLSSKNKTSQNGRMRLRNEDAGNFMINKTIPLAAAAFKTCDIGENYRIASAT